MRHKKLLLGCMICFFPLLVGCSESNTDTDTSSCCSASIAIIDFDGVYVQNYSTDWPIAFNSYEIEYGTTDTFLVIEGSFIINGYSTYSTSQSLENKLNADSDHVYVSSYRDSTSSDISVSSNEDNTSWEITNMDDNYCCSFLLNIDVSPIKEANKSLGVLYIWSYFNVIHDFNGEPIF